jgi:hypothetical protein
MEFQNNTKSKLTKEHKIIIVRAAALALAAVLLFVIFFVILPAPVAYTPVASTPVAYTPVASIVPTNWKGYGYSTDRRCGPNFNNTACPNKQCCSTAGYCGTTNHYCAKVGTPESIYEYPSVMSNGHFNDSRPDWSIEDIVPADTSGVLKNWKGNSYSTNGRCGPNFNNIACPNGQCCSTLGYCGTTNSHCGQVGTIWQLGSISNGRFNDLKPTWSTE